MKKNLFLPLLLIFIFAACTPTDAISPTVELPIYKIGYSPNLEPYREGFRSCANQITTGLFSFQRFHILNDENVDLYIHLGEPEEMPNFTAQIGLEKLVVITHPNNETSPTKTDLQNIFTGRLNNWVKVGGEGEIAVWVLPAENEASQIFQEYYLDSMLFKGSSQVAPGPAQILEVVGSDPLSIAYLPQSWSTSTISALDIGIEVPILVLADSEPEGELREFVACLQKP
ncbi:MAG: hypothetical protein HON98_01300 [Chloroflexi bacterium]|jgi:hypothetical protein|nr:hypothetical protein [Chloroflexota bacterium]MBT3668830.1 hypothetical protein [Chloroflexota bacterium]MBT4004240.1 hypothetical protein [Chloroflexota bacterium]MBT4306544.1 hypothetical protein [Chloroflexota bacterium]MBT4533928.1 hypothetical protein [Chloroflexota bacterium]